MLKSLEEEAGDRATFTNVHLNLARCFDSIGRKDEADRHWAIHIQFDPNSFWTQTTPEHLGLNPTV